MAEVLSSQQQKERKKEGVLETSELLATSYCNPILDADFPDPAVIETEEGFFAYGTHAHGSPRLNIQVAYSPDMVNWQLLPGALEEYPNWAKECLDWWAPQVVKREDEYRLYYTAKPDRGAGMGIAMATSSHPRTFVDTGKFIADGPGYTTIDPFYFHDPKSGKELLYWGSHHQPIKVQELSGDGRTFLPGSMPTAVLYPRQAPYEELLEGFFMTYRPESDRYFAYVSGDNTWERYGVLAYVSTSPFGPFEPIPGDHVILKENDAWLAPGQNSIFTDAIGQEWMLYHAVSAADRYIPGTPFFRRVMCMDRIVYDADGYPRIEDGSPSQEAQLGPMVKRYVPSLSPSSEYER